MSTVEPYLGISGTSTASGASYSAPGAAAASRLGRQITKSVAQIDAGTSVQLARVDSTAELQAARVDAMACVSRKAMQAVALLSQMETQLAQAVPRASDRLATITDLAAAAMNEVVVDTARRVRW